MALSVIIDAWNNFVLNSSRYEVFEPTDPKRAAAVVAVAWGTIQNGGYSAFLMSSYDLDADGVLKAFRAIGAFEAGVEFEAILRMIGISLPATTHGERWDALERHWPDEADAHDVMSEGADNDIEAALERHVTENEAFYLSLL